MNKNMIQSVTMYKLPLYVKTIFYKNEERIKSYINETSFCIYIIYKINVKL